VTDVGSTKLMITREIERILPKGVKFVGAHPMAGSEQRGVDKADRGLFKKSLCIVTDTGKTDKASLNSVKRLWKKIGARVVVLAPGAHDKMVSEISHLPHMLVFALLNSIDNASMPLASTGFADTTRIGASDAKVWKDIAVSNKKEITRSIEGFKKSLAMIEKAIKRENAPRLLKIFKAAKAKREAL